MTTGGSFAAPAECCSVVVATGCLSSPAGTHWVRLRNGDGTEELIVAETGLPASQANVLTRCPDDTFITTVTTVQQSFMGGVYTVTPGVPANLQSWSVRSRSGNVSLNVNGGGAFVMDVNEVISSSTSADSPGVLNDTVQVSATGASDSARVIELRRA